MDTFGTEPYRIKAWTEFTHIFLLLAFLSAGMIGTDMVTSDHK